MRRSCCVVIFLLIVCFVQAQHTKDLWQQRLWLPSSSNYTLQAIMDSIDAYGFVVAYNASSLPMQQLIQFPFQEAKPMAFLQYMETQYAIANHIKGNKIFFTKKTKQHRLSGFVKEKGSGEPMVSAIIVIAVLLIVPMPMVFIAFNLQRAGIISVIGIWAIVSRSSTYR